jgi:hypothetical protein
MRYADQCVCLNIYICNSTVTILRGVEGLHVKLSMGCGELRNGHGGDGHEFRVVTTVRHAFVVKTIGVTLYDCVIL